MDFIVWVADIGSIKKKQFGWCSSDSANNTKAIGADIMDFVHGIAKDLSEGKRISLGFECPLFVPVTNNPVELSSARKGEGNRAWSAGAGSGVLALGLSETVWVFEQIKKLSKTEIVPTFDWSEFSSGYGNLFVWEAFVTGKAKDLTHHGDAQVAANSFWSKYPDISQSNSVQAENPFSLVGAALLRSGLTKDLDFLLTPVVVIKS